MKNSAKSVKICTVYKLFIITYLEIKQNTQYNQYINDSTYHAVQSHIIRMVINDHYIYFNKRNNSTIYLIHVLVSYR